MAQVEIEELETPNEIKNTLQKLARIFPDENKDLLNELVDQQYPDGRFVFANKQNNFDLIPEIVALIRSKNLQETIKIVSESSSLQDILWGSENFKTEKRQDKLERMTILMPKRETGIKIRCRSCGGIEGESITKQTAASDEAATNIVICVSCGKQQ